MRCLTERQLLYLDLLTCDCGTPGWQAAHILGDKGNLSRTIVKPLKTSGFFVNEESIIYCPGKRNTTRKGSNKPKKSEVPYYINKNSEALDKIQHDLANPFTGKIWYYERIYNSEQKELNKKRGIDIIQNNKDETTVSDKHSEATHFLQAYIHLYLWCDKFIKEINILSYEPNVRIPFCLLDTARPLPPCHCCQESYRQIRFEKRYRDLMRILINSNRYLAKIRAKQHGVHNADELQLTDGL